MGNSIFVGTLGSAKTGARPCYCSVRLSCVFINAGTCGTHVYFLLSGDSGS